ncbi:phosphatase [Xanthomonas citri pv. vignicola]|nr:phosphatase [Xanthomonas citri pv. vignicola]
MFDMDGTLLDSTAVVEKIWLAWAERHNVDSSKLLAGIHGVQSKDVIRRFGPSGVDLAGEEEALLNAELAALDGVVAIAGANEFIARLDPSAWAVVTSAPRALAEARMRAVGLPPPPLLIAAEDVEKGKPDPEGFLKAASMLGVPIGDCLIFEDSEAGIQAARAAGASFVAIGGHTQAGDALASIADYSSL